MTRSKRQYGSGCLLKRGKGWAIRWREMEIAPDGTRRKVQRYEALSEVTRKQASDTLAQRMAASGDGHTSMRSRVVFRTLAAEWQAHVLPMYKHSTQKNHRHILEKHLLPRFGGKAMTEITRQEVQAYVAHLVNSGYAPRTTDHIHDVLSAVLRTAVKWGHLQDNPARDVDLPALVNVRPKWALTITQATALLAELPPLARTMVGLALLSGLRRGEIFALRWRDFDEQRQCLTVREAVYDGRFSTPKTAAGVRQIPLSEAAVKLMVDWRAHVKRTEPESLVFSTWSGKPISPNNVVRRWIVPACEALGLKRVTWLTLRRTYSSWAHEKGVPAKVIAQLMGHAKVDTTLNVYTQVVDGSLRRAADAVGSELFTIVHKGKGAAELTH
ncbi:MAG TPA: site-specific integrase [Gemmatimonadales bacterium]|nr:site-specific integrase [Gemmatimonadales bacterium]